AVINGLPIFSCDDFFVDDSGRVFLRVHMQNETIQRSYVWDQGAWTLAVQPNRSQLAGRTVASLSIVRALENRLVALLNTDAGNFVAEWTSSGWSMLMQGPDLKPTGFSLTNLAGQLELGPGGDMVFLGQGSPSQVLFFERSGAIQTILNTGRRTDDGDFLVTIQALDIRQDGTVFILALNENDEQVLYKATPIGG